MTDQAPLESCSTYRVLTILHYMIYCQDINEVIIQDPQRGKNEELGRAADEQLEVSSE